MLGATAVEDNGKIVGIITDGDLRRFFDKNSEIKNAKSKNLMTSNPKVSTRSVTNRCIKNYEQI